jgi:hypothetical protein
MWIFGLILLAISGILIFYYFSVQKKLGLMIETQTREIEFLEDLARKMNQDLGAGSFKNYMTEVKGRIVCNDPLISELSQSTCVYYRMQVEREYEETYYVRDEQGRSHRKTRTASMTVASNQRSVPFLIEDNTGIIRVDPTGAEMITEKALSRYETTRGQMRVGDFSIYIDGYDGDRRILGYRFEENIIPINRDLYILGAATEREGELCIVNPQESGQFIISLKSEEELTKSKQSSAKWTLIGAIGCSLIGVILVVIDLLGVVR